MDLEPQPNPKPDWKIAAFAFLVYAAVLGGIALFNKLYNPQANVWRALNLTLAIVISPMLKLWKQQQSRNPLAVSV